MQIRKILIQWLYANSFLKALLFNPFVEYHQWRLLKFVAKAASTLSPSSRIIDIGAGELKYKKAFSHCSYVSNDLCVGDSGWNYSDIDIVSSAYDIPVEPESFDAILCIQVLEHLSEPEMAFKEFARVLKVGGRVYLSAPLLAGEHQQPHDYFRYTQYGYKSLAVKYGFEVESIKPHGGSIIAIENLMWLAFWEIVPLRRQSALRYCLYFLMYPIKAVSGFFALCFDCFDRRKTMTINYDVILRK